jgi:peptidoglycan/LPS O-acetylase OafA/YrhL
MRSSSAETKKTKQDLDSTNIRPHLRALTSLRFLAALLVVGFHVGHDLWPQAHRWIANCFSNGYEAVSFFFVLSGFVLTYAYGQPSRSKAPSISAGAFWKARIARIYPAYVLALVIAFPAFFYSWTVSNMISWTEFGSALMLVPTLCQSWWPPSATAWNLPAWSLSVEAFFYLVFPFLIRLFAVVKPLRLLVLTLFVVVLTSSLRFWLATSPDLSWDYLIHRHFIAYFPLWFLPHFVFGMALSKCFMVGHPLILTISKLIGLPSVLLIVLIFCARSNLPTWMVSDAVLVALFGVVIFRAAHATRFVGSILSWNPLVQLGESSYALYILHVPLAFWFQWIILRFGVQPFKHWLGFLAFTVISVLISHVVYVFYERPARRLLLRRFEIAGNLCNS